MVALNLDITSAAWMDSTGLDKDLSLFHLYNEPAAHLIAANCIFIVKECNKPALDLRKVQLSLKMHQRGRLKLVDFWLFLSGSISFELPLTTFVWEVG